MKQPIHTSKYKFFNAKLWIGLGLTTLALRFVLGFSPNLVETVYSNGLFLGIRWFFDHTVTRLPFTLAKGLFLLLFIWLLVALFAFFKNRQQFKFKQRLAKALLSLGGFLGLVAFLFFWLWGFNYSRLPVEEKLGIELITPDSLTIMDELAITLKAVLQERRLLEPNDSLVINSKQLQGIYGQDLIREQLEKTLVAEGYSSTGRVNIRTLSPGSLLHFGVAGIYFPFVGEGHVDGGLHPISRTFTVCHEMAHGYGFGDEGTCNFLAYLACTRSEQAALRYVGYMGYLRYLLGTLRRYGDEGYQAYRNCLPEPLVLDLDDIRRVHELYPDWISAAPLNDVYLKAQGVEDGIENYSRIVVLVASMR